MPTGWQPGLPAGASSAVIESASGFPRVSKLSRRFTAFCAPGLPTFRSIPRGRRFARRPFSRRAESRPRWSPVSWLPCSAQPGPATRPLPRLMLVDTPENATAAAVPSTSATSLEPPLLHSAQRCPLCRSRLRRHAVTAVARARNRRPGVHPLHVRFDWRAQRRDAFSWQCVHVS